MREIFRPGRMWRWRGELRASYDVAIIGGGAHGLSTAYHLGRLGAGRVGVLEQGYIGSGAAGRNTTILRSNYKTSEGARFYDASIRMYERLSAELDFNMLVSQSTPPRSSACARPSTSPRTSPIRSWGRSTTRPAGSRCRGSTCWGVASRRCAPIAAPSGRAR
ncbi:MAG: FAD-binding oxidoreductase [Actinomycetota bacterium]|nr:FAD-binding oxidoreductase [Actinomycetota bacterium]